MLKAKCERQRNLKAWQLRCDAWTNTTLCQEVPEMLPHTHKLSKQFGIASLDDS